MTKHFKDHFQIGLITNRLQQYIEIICIIAKAARIFVSQKAADIAPNHDELHTIVN